MHTNTMFNSNQQFQQSNSLNNMYALSLYVSIDSSTKYLGTGLW